MTAIMRYEDQNNELSYMKQLCSIAERSGNYSNMKSETMLNLMLTAKDLGISPMKALNGSFYVVNGKVCMSTSIMADRIRKAGHSIKITEWTNEKCVMIGIRKDNGDSIKFEFTMEDAVRAGLNNSPTWKRYPKNMLYNRAMSTLARTLFPDVVGNAYSEDERYDIQNIPPAQRPIEDPSCLTIEAKLSEEQINIISGLISERECNLEKMLEHFNATCLEEINAEHYEKIIKALSNRPLRKEIDNTVTEEVTCEN